MSRFPVDGTSIDNDGSFADKAECPDCEKLLDLHQPDLHQPDRLLGICPGCQAWILIDIGTGGQLLFNRLPAPPERPPTL